MLLVYLLEEAFDGRGHTPSVAVLEYFLRLCFFTIWIGNFAWHLENCGIVCEPRFNPEKNMKRKLRRARVRHKKGVHGRRPTVRYKSIQETQKTEGFANYMSFEERKSGIEHRFHHVMHFADQFEKACKLNRDFIRLFGRSYIGNPVTRDCGYFTASVEQVHSSAQGTIGRLG